MESRNNLDRTYVIVNCVIALGTVVTVLIMVAPLLTAKIQYNAGSRYLNGEGVEEDVDKSAEFMKASANNGYAEAQYFLGIFYEKGIGVAADFDWATYWYEQSAQQGYELAQEVLRECDCSQHFADTELPIYHFWLSEQRGSKYAAYNLGLRYEEAIGVEQDYEAAMEWYRIAAEKEWVLAQLKVALLYYNGRGTEQDFEQAVYWFILAAEQDDFDAQANLGMCYAEGRGVEQDYEQAIYWYTLAAEQGHSAAQLELGNHYARGEGVRQDYQQAVYWYTLAAERGREWSWAQRNLGDRYFFGEGVETDYSQAVAWYTKAAEKELSAAQLSLGYCYFNGLGVARDFEAAIAWWEKAAEQGNEKAQEFLEKIRNAAETPAEAEIPVSEISISVGIDGIIGVGKDAHLHLHFVPANATNRNVVWSSDNEAVAVVSDADGVLLVKGLSLGTATITAVTEDGGYTASTTITVVEYISVERLLLLDHNEVTVGIGRSKYLNWYVGPDNASNLKVLFASSDESVVTVDQDGVFTGIAEGTATITITTEDGGYAAYVNVTVEFQPVVSGGGVSIADNLKIAKVGEEISITASISTVDTIVRELNWSSSDENVAVVARQELLIRYGAIPDNYYITAKVTALAAGVATITATTLEGEYVTHASVTVLP